MDHNLLLRRKDGSALFGVFMFMTGQGQTMETLLRAVKGSPERLKMPVLADAEATEI